jgi:hypothetical protein
MCVCVCTCMYVGYLRPKDWCVKSHFGGLGFKLLFILALQTRTTTMLSESCMQQQVTPLSLNNNGCVTTCCSESTSFLTYVGEEVLRPSPDLKYWYEGRRIASRSLYTDMRCLTTGIRFEKCVVRLFRRCTIVIERTFTTLHSIACNTPRLYDITYCF